MIVLPNIRAANPADSSAQPVTPQGQPGSTSPIGSFQDSIVAAISASKGQDGSKSQGEKQTRDRNGNADGSESPDSKSGSSPDNQGILYVPAIYIPVIQTPDVQSVTAPVSVTSLQNGAVDANAQNVPAQQEPFSYSGLILAAAPQFSNAAAAANNALLPGNLLKGTPVAGVAGSESAPVSNGALVSSNSPKSTLATGRGASESDTAIPNAFSASSSARVLSEATLPAVNDHSQVNAASSPAVHDNHPNQAGTDAPNQANASSTNANDVSGASPAAAPADSAASLAALAQFAPVATPVPMVASQDVAEILTQSSRQGSQGKVAGIDGTSAKSADASNPDLSAVSTKNSVQDKDSKVSQSQQNQSHDGSQDGANANTNTNQSASQFALNLKDHAASLQSIAGATTPSPSAQSGTDQPRSAKSGGSPEALATNPGQDHMDVSNTGVSTQPIVNTARLIQSINSSELKVGMQSDEFGKISITTSATRDAVLAQIYVDHSELAKTLTTNLPEMQSRVGGQSFDIRVATTSGAGGMSANTSTGDMNQQANQQQQRGNQSFNREIASVSSSLSAVSAPVVLEAQQASLIDNRLDLRV